MNPVGAENQSYLGQTEAAPEKTSIAKKTLGNILNVNDELGLPGVKISEDHPKLQEINKKVKRSSRDYLVNGHKDKKICLEYYSQNEQNFFATCPDEIILSIFSKLNLKDQSKVAMVSSQFKTLANDHALGLMKFKSSYSTRVLKKAFEKDFETLEKDKFIEKFSAELNCVQELDLSSADLSVGMLEFINEFCPSIKKLNLSPIYTTDELLKFLPKKLVSLDLTGWKITDTGLSHLAPLKNLASLNLRGCGKITDAGLSHLAPLKNLASLNLAFCYEITDTGLSYLAPLKNLVSLDLAGCKITDTGLSYLAPLKNLVSLNLTYCNKITDAGLSYLAPLKNLASLSLENCKKITDAGLSHLAPLKNLASLNLAWCTKITDTGLSHLTSLKKLVSLNLAYCYEITDAGLLHLNSLINLASLNLIECKNITDTGLLHLGALKNLASLNLAWCTKITDTGLLYLAKLKNLASLNLKGCKQITDKAIQRFQEENNNIRITF